jgi:FkbM family methyltransferase
MRHPTKIEVFEKIKQLGLPIGSVLDVGVLNGTYDLSRAFRDKLHVLFEPIIEWNDEIHKAYAHIKYELVNIAVSDEIATARLEIYSVSPGKPITHANLLATDRAVSPGMQIREVQTSTLDALMQERTAEKPYLLKIDVDGAELRILSGAAQTLQDTSVVVIEAQPKTFLARTTFMNQAGFDLLEIVDLCYYDDLMSQFDMVFVNRKVMQELRAKNPPKSFERSLWVEYLPA